MKDIITSIEKIVNSKNVVLIIFFLGIGIIIAGIIGGIPQYFIVPPNGKIGFYFLGSIVAFLGGFSFCVDKYWGTKDKILDYGIKINYPTAGLATASPFNITGSYKTLPKEDNIYSIEFNPDVNLYWPKNKLIWDTKNSGWLAKVNIGGGDNRGRKLIIGEVSPGGIAFIEYYIKMSGRSGHIGIKDFNKVFRLLDEVNIVLNA